MDLNCSPRYNPYMTPQKAMHSVSFLLGLQDVGHSQTNGSGANKLHHDRCKPRSHGGSEKGALG